MSIRIKTNARSISKHVSFNQVTMASGIALAVSVAIATGGWRSLTTPGSSSSSAHPTMTAPLVTETRPFLYYLVGSEEQKFDLEGFLRSETSPSSSAYHVAVISIPQQEEAMRRSTKVASEEMDRVGTVFKVIDLRPR